jgi:hypothetical protein
MLSWPPGPSLTLNSINWSTPSYIERKTYRRVGLNSTGVSGSQKFARLAFPPGFSRTRLKEGLINNSDSGAQKSSTRLLGFTLEVKLIPVSSSSAVSCSVVEALG